MVKNSILIDHYFRSLNRNIILVIIIVSVIPLIIISSTIYYQFRVSYHEKVIDHLRELLRAYDVERIVVGQPLTMDGRVGAAAKRAAQLARRLRRELGVAVELWDERLTTAQGERLLRGQRAPRGARDRIAVTLILQSYLDRLDRKKP